MTESAPSAATQEAFARAFSGHRFEEVLDRLADDVLWVLPGSQPIRGRDAVAAACRGTASDLVDVQTTWLRFVCVCGDDVVAVDSVARYEGSDGAAVVSSCDIYEFVDDVVTVITSYTVEVDESVVAR